MFEYRKKRPTRRQSQRPDLSRLVLAHESRQAGSWLIFDVGRKKRPSVKYYRTDIDVRLGDCVVYRHLFFGKSSGAVAYLPGVSKVNPRIIPNQWAVRLESGKGVFMLHSDDLKYAHRRIEFVSRGSTESAITPDEIV